jgi:hypothetical protein
MLLGVALLHAGCTASRLHIQYDPARPPDGGTIYSAGTGDDVEITIADGAWLNHYAVELKPPDGVATDAPPIAGAVELTAAAALAAALRTIEPPPLSEAAPLQSPFHPGASASDSSCVPAALATYLRRTPSVLPLAAFLTDTVARRLAKDLVKDSLPRRVQDVVARYTPGHAIEAAAGAQRDQIGDSSAPARAGVSSGVAARPAWPRPTADAFDSLRVEVAIYARRLDALAARFAADPASFTPDPGFGLMLEQAMRCKSSRGDTVGGVEVAALADSATMQLIDDLMILQRRVAELARGMNLLARWTDGPDSTRIVLGPFHSPGVVTATVKRSDRIPAYGIGSVVQAPAAPPKQDCPDGTNGKGCPRDAAAETRVQGEPPRPPAQIVVVENPAAAAFRIEILQRYRFRFGVGIGYSSLESITFETKDDSTDAGKGVYLREVGRTPNQVVPLATLSYVLFPWNGKLISPQRDQFALIRQNRWREYFERAGLAIQAGMSVSDLTDNVFAALVTEPIAGVELGVGGHFSRIDVARVPVDSFLPAASGSPLRKGRRTRWWAFTVSIDGSVVGRTLASLLGLK